MTKKSVAAALLMGAVSIITGLIVFKALTKEHPAEFPALLPAFELTTPEGLPFTADSLGTGNTIVVYYTPGCLFCEHEGRELVRHAAEFTGTQLLFITSAPADSAAAYAKRTGIEHVPRFYSIVDTARTLPLLLGIRTSPTTLIYDERRAFIRAFEGEVNAAMLLKTLREHEAAPEK